MLHGDHPVLVLYKWVCLPPSCSKLFDPVFTATPSARCPRWDERLLLLLEFCTPSVLKVYPANGLKDRSHKLHFAAIAKLFKQITAERTGTVTQHLEDMQDAIEQEVDADIGIQYETRAHQNMATASTFCEAALSEYCSKRGQVKEFVLKVIVANLNYLGSRWGNCLDVLAEPISNRIANNPDRTCAIVVCPLVAARSESDCADTIAEQIREVLVVEEVEGSNCEH